MNVYAAIALQVASALAIVWLVYLAATKLVLEKDIAAQDSALGTRTVSTLVFNGTATLGVLADKHFDTVNPSAASFAAMPRCILNCDGNAFTISMWMRMASVPAKDMTVFVKGDPEKYTVGGVIVKCPMLTIKAPPSGNSGDFALEVAFNTLRTRSESLVVSSDRRIGDDDAVTLRLGGILGSWVMLTMVFSDTRRADGAPAGMALQLYINDALLASKSIEHDALKWNNGDLVFFPRALQDGADTDAVVLADFRFTNRSLSQSDVRSVFRRRFNTKPARFKADRTNNPATADILDVNQFHTATLP